MRQFGFIPILLVIIIAIVAGVSGYFVYQKSQTPKILPPEDQVVCTQDVKLCPDGSSVGRSGPKCEFTPCPSPKESTSSGDVSNWKTYIDNEAGYSVNYPPNYKINAQKQNGWVSFYLPKTIKDNPGDWQEEFMISIKKTSETNVCIKKIEGYPDTKCIKIANVTFLDWHHTEQVGPIAFTYTTIHNGKEFEVSFLDVNENKKDQILSTFKFLP